MIAYEEDFCYNLRSRLCTVQVLRVVHSHVRLQEDVFLPYTALPRPLRPPLTHTRARYGELPPPPPLAKC